MAKKHKELKPYNGTTRHPSDDTICRDCKELKPRIYEGRFPNKVDKRYVDDTGHQWDGLRCPSCVRTKNRLRYQEKKKKLQAQEQNNVIIEKNISDDSTSDS